MRRTNFAICYALAVAALIAPVYVRTARAQSGLETGASGPRWETRDADLGARPLAGTETFRVSRDAAAASRPAGGIQFAVRVVRTNQVIVCDTLPFTFRWDTAKAPEGWHWLELVMLDPTGDQPDRVIDSLKVYVRNQPATPELPMPHPSAIPSVAIAQPAGTPTPEVRPIGTTVVLASRRRDPRVHVPRLPHILLLPDAATPTPVAATVADSENPFAVPRASALCKDGDKLYIGLPDGGIAIWDDASKQGKVVRLPQLAGRVRALSAAGGVVCWTAGTSDIVYRFQEKDGSVDAFDASAQTDLPVASPVEDALSSEGRAIGGPHQSPDVPEPPVAAPPRPTWIERLAVVGKRVVLMGTAATRFLEPDGSLKTMTDELPKDVADNYADGLVQCYVGSAGSVRDALLLFATPDVSGRGGNLRLYTGDAVRLRDDWHDRGTLVTSVPLIDRDARKPGPALTPYGIALPEQVASSHPDTVQFAALTDRDSAVNPMSIPLGVSGDYNINAPQSAERIACGGSGVWWEQSGILFHVDPFTAKRESYLPWNGAGTTVTALLADKEGAYVATDKGIRHILPGEPNDDDGYNGYVRAPLGDDYAIPATDREKQLATNIDTWQGVPYKWGGTTMTGTDCSGFVGAMHQSLGVTLPRTSEEMGKTDQGVRVRDELHYGDTLVYPGHVALYIGNGRTAETVGGTGTGAVGKASIWRRRDVIVKRFWPGE